MKRIGIGVILLIIIVTIAACNNNKQNANNVGETGKNQESAKQPAEKPGQEPAQAQDVSLTAADMIKQGNPTRVHLSDIAEINNGAVNAWIKLSTQYDPELSMYSYDSLASGTKAVAVTFSVSDFDGGEATLVWCYQLKSGDTTTSVWDTSSPADALTITEDGTYQMVFDAEAALGGVLDTIESLQILFPCGSETTSTIVDISKLQCITDREELKYFSTGKIK